MPKLTIDGTEVEVEVGTSILQACEKVGVEIPRFCYHDRLSVPANCRMCLVELEKAPKPVASCAMPCGEGMVIHTKSPKVQKARRGVMEMLLINHPLDCPICDQGGECDLQDQAMAYGFDRSRYAEAKRAVKDKELGPLIKTIMTRCIHCTRCVRFGEEIAGVADLGLLNRGNDVEIGTYVESAISSELSGNMVDVCPVGALTSKPYAFNARPWELKKTETIDVLDAVGSNIRVDSRGNEVMRVLPRLHEEINEEWIADKTRYSYDGLKYQRLDQPYVRSAKGKLEPASWGDAFNAIADQLNSSLPETIAALVGDLVDCESIMALKDLMKKLGTPHMDCQIDGTDFDRENRSSYLFNAGIKAIEEADVILIVGANPKWEATMINARIRKAFLKNKTKIGLILNDQPDLTYDYDYLGAGSETLASLLDHKMTFAKALEQASNPMVIIGTGALNRSDSLAIQNLAGQVCKKYKASYNILHTAASRVGALDLGFVPSKKGLNALEIIKKAALGQINFLYLLGADLPKTKIHKNCFVVYQGHHGDRGAQMADVILPGAAYTEKNATYVNTEGRVQQTRKAVDPVGEAKEDWKIIRALSDVIDKTLPYDTLFALRERMEQENKIFSMIDVLPEETWQALDVQGKTLKTAFVSPIDNYYITDVISRSSRIMAQCVEKFIAKDSKSKRGTHD